MFDECDRDKVALGYCHAHYRQHKAGKELTPLNYVFTGTMEDRLLWYSVKTEDGCWEWTGFVSDNGYGVTTDNDLGTGRLAHRVAFKVLKGEDVTDADVIHHTCSNSICINPEHLQKIDQLSNVAEMMERKSYQKEIKNLRKTVEIQQKTIDKCCKKEEKPNDGV